MALTRNLTKRLKRTFSSISGGDRSPDQQSPSSPKEQQQQQSLLQRRRKRPEITHLSLNTDTKEADQHYRQVAYEQGKRTEERRRSSAIVQHSLNLFPSHRRSMYADGVFPSVDISAYAPPPASPALSRGSSSFDSSVASYHSPIFSQYGGDDDDADSQYGGAVTPLTPTSATTFAATKRMSMLLQEEDEAVGMVEQHGLQKYDAGDYLHIIEEVYERM